MNCRIIAAAIILALAWPLPALAHPHIFVLYDVTLAPADKGFTKLHFTFDIKALANPLFTPGAQGADNPSLERDMLANLAAHPFYLYLDIDGQSMGRQEVHPVPAGDGGTSYAFDLNLPDTGGNFGFSLYDPEYFVSVRQKDAHSVKTRIAAMTCTVQDQNAGKTVWGIIHAQYVACGSKGAKPLIRHLDKQPPAPVSPGARDGLDGQGYVP